MESIGKSNQKKKKASVAEGVLSLGNEAVSWTFAMRRVGGL